nr:hypothetical protein [Sicyoidochytrium minutum DNA virus]
MDFLSCLFKKAEPKFSPEEPPKTYTDDEKVGLIAEAHKKVLEFRDAKKAKEEKRREEFYNIISPHSLPPAFEMIEQDVCFEEALETFRKTGCLRCDVPYTDQYDGRKYCAKWSLDTSYKCRVKWKHIIDEHREDEQHGDELHGP